MIPEKFHDIFEKGSLGHLGTLMPNGSIQITPVLVVKEGDVLKVSTTRARQKCKNLMANPTATVEIMDPENRFHYVEVRGKATVADDVNNAFVDSLARRFLGKDRYDMDPPGEVRVVITIGPDRVRGL
jgi:PPOX class probable F420-dependent enzyme